MLTIQGNLLELTLIGESDHVLLAQQFEDSSIHYRIFNCKNGNLMFNQSIKSKPISFGESNLYCIGLIFHRKIETEESLEDDDSDSDEDYSQNYDNHQFYELDNTSDDSDIDNSLV